MGTAIVSGDFNPDIEWKSKIGNAFVQEEIVEYIRVCLKHSVIEPIDEEAVLDLVTRNEKTLIRGLVVKDLLESSDHDVLEFHIQLEGEHYSAIGPFFHLNKDNYNDMMEELSKVDWKNNPRVCH